MGWIGGAIPRLLFKWQSLEVLPVQMFESCQGLGLRLHLSIPLLSMGKGTDSHVSTYMLIMDSSYNRTFLP